jgi:hypothetical protein
MNASRPTTSSFGASDPAAFEPVIPTSESDVRRLRALRETVTGSLFERLNDLSATRQFPSLTQRRTTSAGFAPFTLVDE